MADRDATPTTRDAVMPPVQLLRPREIVVRTPVPVRVGRFSLIEQIGKGGMGVVYSAYDPQLDRKVALKLVDDRRFADPEEARERLEQEARAAANLSHPNVVTIYDVGVHEGRVFLAMEFVQGTTLTGWLRARRRSWREIVAMFVQAGRGLAAAHAARLAHRDFKPDNVLIGGNPLGVGDDGRPRVADFGLAQPLSYEPGAAVTFDGQEVARSSERFPTPIIAGTPAYMAPEQFDGIDVGPAADQFAFCVALFEALFRKRPFAGTNAQELAVSVCEGRVEIPPGRHDVPRALVGVLARGLQREARDRHATMDELLARLERILHARRRRTLAAAAVVLGVTALGVGYQAAEAVAPQPCENADEVQAAMWPAPRRAATHAALATIGSERASAVVGALDAYAEKWAGKRVEICEASRVHGEQSDLAMQLRMTCLDRMQGRFEGFTAELADGGDPSRIDVDTVATQLPALAQCDDVETLARLSNRYAARSARSSTDQDRAWTEAVELVERALTRHLLGRADARDPAERAAELAEQHDLPGVHSRALSLLAELELEAGRTERAEELRRDAVRLAVEDGNEDAAVHLMLDQADAAIAEERVREAELHLGYFDAFLDRMEDPQARQSVQRRASIIRGQLELLSGDAEAAERRLSAAVDADELGALDLRPALMALGTAQRTLGRPEEAIATWRRLLDLVSDLRGDRHADVASVLNNLALARLDLGRHEDAEAALVRAESIAVDAVGEQHPLVAAIACNRGWAERLAGHPEQAKKELERALAIGRATLGHDHPSLAYAFDELGELDREAGRFDAALDWYAQAGQLRDAALGPDHPETATTLTGMGRVFLAKGELARARGALEAALRIRKAHPGDPKKLAETEALLVRAQADDD